MHARQETQALVNLAAFQSSSFGELCTAIVYEEDVQMYLTDMKSFLMLHFCGGGKRIFG